MSWSALLILAVAGYALKALGPLLLGDRRPSETVARALALLAVPLLAALVVVQTVGVADRMVIDARLPAVAVAALLVWRGAPFLVVVLAAAAVAAGLRAVL
ncbi:MAG: AzlD domain-containing protein [Actinomycetota bacterium]|nr:AzlD domain-containing protein [Actinomycetota bacterium]